MPSLTIKQLDQRLLERLREQASRRDLSLNAFVRQILARAVGYDTGAQVHSDLSDLAGTWSDRDEQEFLESIRPLREIDESLWR
jgi:plasmid stability protein